MLEAAVKQPAMVNCLGLGDENKAGVSSREHKVHCEPELAKIPDVE